MIKNNTHKQHETSACSAQEGGSPLQFYAMNSIYQLQSIINRLSIQKQKNNIEYVNSLNLYQKENQRLKYRLQTLTKDKQIRDQQLQKTSKQAHAWKNKADELQKNKNQMQKMLLALSTNQSQAYVELQADCQKLKTHLLQKTKEIGNLQLTIAQISNKQQNARALNNEIRNNFQQKIKTIYKSKDDQHSHLREQIRKLHNERNNQKQKLYEMIKQLKAKINVLVQQKQQLTKKLLKYRKQIHDMRIVIFDRDNSKPTNQANNKEEKIFAQLQNKLNELISQNIFLVAQSNSKTKQFQILQKQSKAYIQQIEALQLRLASKNETELNIKKMFQQKQICVPKLQPTDHLAKLLQLSSQFTRKNQMLQHQQQTLQKRINCMKQLMDESQNQKIMLQERVATYKSMIQRYEQKCQQLKTVNGKRQIELMEQKSRADAYENRIRQIQLLNRRQMVNSSNQNMQVVSVDKYYSILQSMNNLSTQKTNLLKSNIQLQSQLQKVQDQLIKRVKHQKQLQFQIQQQKRKFNKLYADKQECIETIHKLQLKINKNQSIYNEDRAGLIKKIQIFNECVGKIKKEKQVKKNQKHLRPLSCDNKVLQLKIRPPINLTNEHINLNTISIIKNPEQIKHPIKQNISKKIEQKFRNFQARRFLAPAHQKNRSINPQQFDTLKSESNTIHSSKQLKKRITFGSEGIQNLGCKEQTQTVNKKIRTQLSAQKICERIQQLKKSSKQLSKMKQF